VRRLTFLRHADQLSADRQPSPAASAPATASADPALQYHTDEPPNLDAEAHRPDRDAPVGENEGSVIAGLDRSVLSTEVMDHANLLQER